MEKLLSFNFFIIFHKATRKFYLGTERMIRMKLQYIYVYIHISSKDHHLDSNIRPHFMAFHE